MHILNLKLRTPTIYLMGILSILMVGILFSAQSSITLGEDKVYDDFNQPIASSMVDITNSDNYFMENITYMWYDASYNGENIWMEGDDTYYELNLPFTFNFYEEFFETLYISSNGWMSFTDTNPYEYSNPSFPSADPSFEYAIAVFWDDLQAENNVYIWETTDFVVIEYNGYNHLSSELAGTFEVILFATGEIVFQYQNINLDQGATVGLNHGLNRTLFTEYMPDMGGEMELALKLTKEDLIDGHDLRIYIEPSNSMDLEMTHWVEMTVGNFGSYSEMNVNVTLYMEEVEVLTYTNLFLEIGEIMSFTYEWTPNNYREYNFTAMVNTVEGETRIFNNRMTYMFQINNNSIPMEVGDLMMWRSFHDEWNEFIKLEVVGNLSPNEFLVDITTFDRETGAETVEQVTVNSSSRECATFGGHFPYWINVENLNTGTLMQIMDNNFDGEIVGSSDYYYNGFNRPSEIVQMNDNSRRIFDSSTGIFIGYEMNDIPNLELIYTNIFEDLPSHHNLYAHFSVVDEDADEDSVLVSAFIMNTGNYMETANVGIYLDGNALHTETFYDMNPGEYHFINMGRMYPTVIPTHGDALFTLEIDEVFDESYADDNSDENWVYMGENEIGILHLIVYDQDGNPLPDVEVKVDGISSIYNNIFYTDHNGEIYVENMPLGEFYVKISMNGYRDYSFNYWVDEYDTQYYEEIYLKLLFEVDDDDDTDPFGSLGIPGYDLGSFIVAIGISLAALGKRKQK